MIHIMTKRSLFSLLFKAKIAPIIANISGIKRYATYFKSLMGSLIESVVEYPVIAFKPYEEILSTKVGAIIRTAINTNTPVNIGKDKNKA